MSSSIPRKGGVLLIEGLNIETPAEYISDQQSSNTENFLVDRNLLSKRPGTSVLGGNIGGDDKEIMAGREFNREGVLYNVRIGVDNIENYDSGSSSWSDITGTTLTGDATNLVDTAVPLLSGKRILCITNGIDNIRKWTATGNTSDLGGSPPVAKFIQEYKTYLVCANIQGGTDISQRVQWSDTADPEEWSTGNSGSVDLTEDGDDITGLGLFGDFICVHKKSSIYIGTLVSTTKIFQFDRKATGAGTVANGSIVNIPSGEQIFLSFDGIRIFDGVTAPLIVSPINDEIRDELNQEQAYKSWAVLVLEKDEVWMGVPIGSQTRGETVYRYNYKRGVLYKDIRLNINTAWRATQSSAETWDDMTGSWDDQTLRWNDGQIGALSGQINFGTTTGQTFINNPSSTSDAIPFEYGTGGDTVSNITVGSDTYRLHQFTSTGSSSFVAPTGFNEIEVLVVAGGGGGGNDAGGGGGAGGLVYNSDYSYVEAETISVTVGAGGAAINDGSDSVFGTITAVGGGRGGGASGSANDGGSGGGGSFRSITPGSGTAGQGNDGGLGVNNFPTLRVDGGGGGAGEAGKGVPDADQDGGDGLEYDITGTATYYAGGGGGGGANFYAAGTGGQGGGGNGGTYAASGGAAGTANTGGGGGGAGQGAFGGGAGGSGVVIARYNISQTNSTPIVATWDSKDFTPGSLGQLARFQQIWVWAKGSGNLQVWYSVDEGENWEQASNSPIVLTNEFPSISSPQRVYLDEVSQYCRVRFIHEDAGTCQIKQFYVAYVPREYMK